MQDSTQSALGSKRKIDDVFEGVESRQQQQQPDQQPPDQEQQPDQQNQQQQTKKPPALAQMKRNIPADLWSNHHFTTWMPSGPDDPKIVDYLRFGEDLPGTESELEKWLSKIPGQCAFAENNDDRMFEISAELYTQRESMDIAVKHDLLIDDIREAKNVELQKQKQGELLEILQSLGGRTSERIVEKKYQQEHKSKVEEHLKMLIKGNDTNESKAFFQSMFMAIKEKGGKIPAPSDMYVHMVGKIQAKNKKISTTKRRNLYQTLKNVSRTYYEVKEFLKRNDIPFNMKWETMKRSDCPPSPEKNYNDLLKLKNDNKEIKCRLGDEIYNKNAVIIELNCKLSKPPAGATLDFIARAYDWAQKHGTVVYVHGAVAVQIEPYLLPEYLHSVAGEEILENHRLFDHNTKDICIYPVKLRTYIKYLIDCMEKPKAKIRSFVECDPKTGKEGETESKENHSGYANDIDLENYFPDAYQTFQESNFLYDFGPSGARSLDSATSRDPQTLQGSLGYFAPLDVYTAGHADGNWGSDAFHYCHNGYQETIIIPRELNFQERILLDGTFHGYFYSEEDDSCPVTTFFRIAYHLVPVNGRGLVSFSPCLLSPPLIIASYGPTLTYYCSHALPDRGEK
jgi:hypothetical protein